MTTYALILLSGPTIEGEPGPLPAPFVGLKQSSLNDLSFTGADFGGAYVGKGFWPVDEIRPAPAAGQRNALTPTLAADAENMRVTATYEVEAMPLAEAKAARKTQLAAYRYERETGGIVLGGAALRTDRESQALVSGAFQLVQAAPETVIDWKGADGWVQLDAATMSAIAMAVATHVQACFSAEKVHAEAIDACETAEEAATYDFTTDWPA